MDPKNALNCIVETPKGYGVKYNYDPKLARIELTKVLPAGLVFPFDFGYIPGTKGEDGDPLDVIIISEVPSFPGCAVKCRIIGAIKASQRERDGEVMRNDRYIAIPAVSAMYVSITKSSQLPEGILEELQHFFINYNKQAGKKFKPLALVGPGRAIAAIRKAQKRSEPTKLVQLLLPLNSPNGTPYPKKHYKAVKKTFVKEFGGVTIYSQSPASGLWKEGSGNKVLNDVVMVYEVMVGRIDRSFWKQYKKRLEKRFRQKEIVVRQTTIGLL